MMEVRVSELRISIGDSEELTSTQLALELSNSVVRVGRVDVEAATCQAFRLALESNHVRYNCSYFTYRTRSGQRSDALAPGQHHGLPRLIP